MRLANCKVSVFGATGARIVPVAKLSSSCDRSDESCESQGLRLRCYGRSYCALGTIGSAFKVLCDMPSRELELRAQSRRDHPVASRPPSTGGEVSEQFFSSAIYSSQFPSSGGVALAARVTGWSGSGDSTPTRKRGSESRGSEKSTMRLTPHVNTTKLAHESTTQAQGFDPPALV